MTRAFLSALFIVGLAGVGIGAQAQAPGQLLAQQTAPGYPMLHDIYIVNVTGGQEFPPARRMTVHELGNGVVGNFGRYTQYSGTLAPDTNVLTGTWKGPTGQGWLRLRFAVDSRSFQGEWGLTNDTQPRGRIGGTTIKTAMRAMLSGTGQRWVRGLWDTASSSSDFAMGRLRLEQQDEHVTGFYAGGHLEGTLPGASHVLRGRWRSAGASGYFVLTFAPDGKTFQGTWTSDSGAGGSIIGRRVIAASPALR